MAVGAQFGESHDITEEDGNLFELFCLDGVVKLELFGYWPGMIDATIRKLNNGHTKQTGKKTRKKERKQGPVQTSNLIAIEANGKRRELLSDATKIRRLNWAYKRTNKGWNAY